MDKVSISTHQVYLYLPYGPDRICIRLLICFRRRHCSHRVLLFVGYSLGADLLTDGRWGSWSISDGFTF